MTASLPSTDRPVCRSKLRRWRPGWPCDPADVLKVLRRGAGDPAYRSEPDNRAERNDRETTVWRAIGTPDGPVTLRVRPRPNWGEVEFEAWGPGADWALQQGPDMCGADDDPAGFRPSQPLVARAWAANPHWRVTRAGRVLESLVAAVVEQKVTGQEAWRGWRLLVIRFGAPAPGPGGERQMRCPPTPDVLRQIPSWEWLRCHVDPARSATIVRSARRADALERTLAAPPDQVDARLTSIAGVGSWTAAEVRQRAHGDADAVSFGDYHIPNHIGWALLGRDITDAELADLLEPDRPHRYRVQHVVTTRLSGRPRRGPRMPPRHHLPR